MRTRAWASASAAIALLLSALSACSAGSANPAELHAATQLRQLLDAVLSQKTEAWKGHGYGYGVWIDDYPGGGRWIGGIGGEMGSNSEAWFSPTSNYLVVVLSNFDPGAAIQVSEYVRARVPLR